MLRMLVFLFAACALSNAAATELAIAPKIDPQDSWTYVNTTEDKAGWHQTREDITVIRASSTGGQTLCEIDRGSLLFHQRPEPAHDRRVGGVSPGGLNPGRLNPE
jgi:hypothetical protein